jgi:hypothetical protein
MSLDHLLLWLSAKGAGSWPQFRAAVEELHIQRPGSAPDDPDVDGERSAGTHSDLPVYHDVRFALQRLGHVEFCAGETEQGWRVVPPTVAFLPGASASGLLCGARSTNLLERLHSVADVEAMPVEGMPQRVLLRGASQDAIAARARVLGLHIQEAASIALLCAVPGVRDTATWLEAPMPETPGWTVHRFSPSRLQWTAVSQDAAAQAGTGLFRFVLKHQRFYYLHWRGCSYKIPVQVGKYAVIGKRRGILAYENARGVFSVPAICRPPLLVERALVLCSGVLPRFDQSSGRVEYAEVPQDVARLAAQLLCQELR